MLTPGAPLELNPTATTCNLVLATAPEVPAVVALSLYPNPAETTLTLNAPWPDYEAIVQNSTGQQVLRGSNLRQLPTGARAPGLYVVTVRSRAGAVLRQRFSVLHP